MAVQLRGRVPCSSICKLLCSCGARHALHAAAATAAHPDLHPAPQCGGSEAAVEAARPLLEAMGKRIVHCEARVHG